MSTSLSSSTKKDRNTEVSRTNDKRVDTVECGQSTSTQQPTTNNDSPTNARAHSLTHSLRFPSLSSVVVFVLCQRRRNATEAVSRTTNERKSQRVDVRRSFDVAKEEADSANDDQPTVATPTNSLTHSLTHSLPHTHSLTHSLTDVIPSQLCCIACMKLIVFLFFVCRSSFVSCRRRCRRSSFVVVRRSSFVVVRRSSFVVVVAMICCRCR